MANLPTPAIPTVEQFRDLKRQFLSPMTGGPDRARDRFVSYLRTYPTLLAHFGKRPLTPHDLQLGALATYAWMATTLIVREDITSDTVGVFERARDAVEPLGEDLEALVRTFNNSLVGVSKMLHFAAPEYHPIWDSNVAYAVYGSGYYHVVSSVDRYTTYARALRQRVDEHAAEFEAIVWEMKRRLMAQRLPTSHLAPLRAAELLIFATPRATHRVPERDAV